VPVDPSAYRTALGLFVTGVTVVSIADPETGEPRGMTANGFMSVSLEPPLVVVSLRNEARLRAPLEQAGAYGVTLLPAAREDDARRFAGMATSTHSEPRWTDRDGIPVLEDALAWLTARVVDAHPAGDHTLFVGEVTALAAAHSDATPLTFFRSRFGALPDQGRAPAPLDPWGATLDFWS
jgi:flavin reductase (DIM6/NTAB) family NADH-FMN oxidoreductase RutF